MCAARGPEGVIGACTIWSGRPREGGATRKVGVWAVDEDVGDGAVHGEEFVEVGAGGDLEAGWGAVVGGDLVGWKLVREGEPGKAGGGGCSGGSCTGKGAVRVRDGGNVGCDKLEVVRSSRFFGGCLSWDSFGYLFGVTVLDRRV